MAEAAARFHATLIAALAEWVIERAVAEGLDRVVLGGGCFLNHILATGLDRRLAGAGLRVFLATEVPPGDGGLSLGQAEVARAERRTV